VRMIRKPSAMMIAFSTWEKKLTARRDIGLPHKCSNPRLPGVSVKS
jgi:hypothetical protein